MKQKLSLTNRIWIGFTLFSMFFGAGNLIFPPFLGYQAGRSLWKGFAGFLMSAVLFPLLGVAAVALAGGLDKLAGRIHPKFATIFSLLIYLSIGPCLAIPRTAGTSYEMAVLPLFGKVLGENTQFVYMLLFFGAAWLISLKPERISDWLGKMMTPCLLVLIILIFVGCIFWPVGQWAEPSALYQENPVSSGFLAGYQTMDTMAALNFGIVIALNIQAKGVKHERSVMRETVYAGLLAGLLLALVYGVLVYIGSIAGTGVSQAENGTAILNWVVNELYGTNGLRILAVLFFISCFNVCVGLICCCSEYFSRLVVRIPYKLWTLLFSVVSLGIANVGLNRILVLSLPVIHALYPVAIVLISLAFVHPWIKHVPLVYPYCVLTTALASTAESILPSLGENHALNLLLEHIPGYGHGFGWLLPALFGAAAGVAVSAFSASGKQ